MDSEENTTVFSTLKSFNSFIGCPATSSSTSGSTLQSQYKRNMDWLEAAEKVQSYSRYLQLDQEKKQMELSHKRVRVELEKSANDSACNLKLLEGKNSDMSARTKKLEEREKEALRNLSERVEANRELSKNLESLGKKVEERDARLSASNQTIICLKDEIRDLKQKLQNQDSILSNKKLEKQEVQEQLDLQRRKYQEMSQLCQSLQAAQSTCSEHVMKIKELERRLALQEQDAAIVRTIKSEATRVPDLEKEVKRLRGENLFLRDNRENCSLLKEEVEGLKRKLERTAKAKEDLVNMELEKERLTEKIRAWENLGQSTGLNIRKPEDLSREVIQIQQREITLQEENYTLNSRLRNMERSLSELRAQMSQQHGKTLEEQKKREGQSVLLDRLQRRFLLLTKERDGMRAILESYDSELAPAEHSPQLSRRLKEAEEMLLKTQALNTEMEAQLTKVQDETGTLKMQLQTLEFELESLRKQQAAPDDVCSVSKEEVNMLRQKIEDLEAERQRLEREKEILEMRLERHNLQGDYDPVKTQVLHLKMNPTSVGKQERQQEIESLRQEAEHLRDVVRKLQEGGHSQLDAILHSAELSLPPPKEVLDLQKQIESSELRNQRLKEVFQKKIQEFRTVCYILTGYQIDIPIENQYRLTSVYAEHMEDWLVFQKGSNGNMQLMETAFTKTLDELVNLHLHHQNSIPVFISAVTLELYSRQTTV
ncbi:mitotic spindle assembly checkpoint protein MAD1 [Entelurus aequoreus]|uniref:mitotic spindle assembly checkpoint protein MAD1 n=1 Tax=Entelurus aequoreus TaxID=161455 RepID=UPI002B1D846C|nr:mitotic spindle assembly checkpoint protein MAD1 [Entelurus aequoreus]XP_061882564.1 mitotic spindle assembly checkpoint protein MAD1 [Entelurus aequoreus]XP_061882565.1 mitotic spindle assembly checkpoint protein MAD1 [Entelurus aequoreus]XP_061882566.1 mitotic spindle assembly checkpoint protein MAD1 [Entelurus aequoreus]XP_061882567.1 mitotic spindle assembly checkpoint protein MAD1 [Entelurus aequoreus]XP_061882568.1 mitotic spindle assembly checkpoint protein MAD1 [Entelurus aequoreus]